LDVANVTVNAVIDRERQLEKDIDVEWRPDRVHDLVRTIDFDDLPTHFQGEGEELTARMSVGYKLIVESFTTHVTTNPAARRIDDVPAGIVFMSSVNTYQAYNNYPYDPPKGVGWDDGAHPLTGRSLYDFNSPVTKRYPDGRPAVKVSFDRPYSSQYGNPGNGGLTDFEPFTIAFLEKRGPVWKGK
jgi:hypothetical protein